MFDALSDLFTMLLGPALFLVTVFLILLILVQRGRGGGLAGALGGMGGESALGTKAGDVFTKITIVTALIWILLCTFTYKLYEPIDLQVGDSGSQLGDVPENQKGDDTTSDEGGEDAGGAAENPVNSGLGSTEDLLKGLGDAIETPEETTPPAESSSEETTQDETTQQQDSNGGANEDASTDDSGSGQ